MSMRSPAGFISAFFDPLKNPNAPTIGTATGGDAFASVSFTPPANVGGSAISAYYAVSNPGQVTVSGTASPIKVTGLTNGTAYTFSVWALNTYGPGPFSEASGSVTPEPLVIGQAYGGGFYAGNIVQGGSTYYLIVAPKSSGENSSIQWKTSNSAGPTATITLNNGFAASSSMDSAAYPAAQFCEGLSIGGYTDWYMPARDELEICYRNLKPTTNANSTFERPLSSYTYPEGNDVPGDKDGVNRNSAPTGAAYTSSVPAQTSVTDFRSGGSEAFAANTYWSSSEFSSTQAWFQDFTNGSQNVTNKANVALVRAVRRVAV